jgi:hypothetical protein
MSKIVKVQGDYKISVDSGGKIVLDSADIRIGKLNTDVVLSANGTGTFTLDAEAVNIDSASATVNGESIAAVPYVDSKAIAMAMVLG